MPVPIKLAHYDPNLGDPVSIVRLYCGDTSDIDPDFSDQELTQFLNLCGSNVELAAARALRTLATDRARLAVISKKGTRGNDESAVYKALVETAEALEENAIVAPSISAPDQIFSTDSASGTVPGTMSPW